MRTKGLTGNQLKLVALVTMTIDHIGVQLFPQNLLLRCIGRLAFPIYAYMIAEGCRYTRSMHRHFAAMAAFAAAIQLVYSLAMGTLHQCILVTFALSVGLIWVLQTAQSRKNAEAWITFAAAVAAVLFITEGLPVLLQGTDFYVDYGFFGVMLPVGVYLGRTKGEKLGITTLSLLAMCITHIALHIFSLLYVALLSL